MGAYPINTQMFYYPMLKLDGYRMWQYDLTQEQLKNVKQWII